VSELDPAAREYIDRERAAWRGADAIPTGGADRAWAAAPARARNLARARLARIVVTVAALSLLGLGLLGLPAHKAPTQPRRTTASDAGVLVTSSPPVHEAPLTVNADQTPTTEPPVTTEVPVVTAPTQTPPPVVSNHKIPANKPRVTDVPVVATARPQAVDSRPQESDVRRDAGVAISLDAATEEDSLDAEFRLLRAARVAIRDGQLEKSLQICAEHATKFPNGALTPERRSIERRARCLIADRDGRATPDECR